MKLVQAKDYPAADLLLGQFSPTVVKCTDCEMTMVLRETTLIDADSKDGQVYCDDCSS